MTEAQQPSVPGQKPATGREPLLLFVLALLLGFASISTDLFLPALPTMRSELGATEALMGFVVSAYLLGFAAGQLFWGPVSDRVGRRIPIGVGVLVFAIGSAGCALSTDAYQIIGWRLVQALGASAGVVLARAVVRDLYERNSAARVLSTLMTIMAIAPLLGPSVGAQILAFASWQAIFWTLFAIGIATLGGVLTLPETLPVDLRKREPLIETLLGYRELFASPRLVGYALSIGLFYVGLFANIAGAPFAFITYYGLSPELYGLIFASGVFGLMVTNIINARTVQSAGSDVMLRWGAIGAVVAGAGMLVFASMGQSGLLGLIVFQTLYHAVNGLILANGVAGALASIETRTGAASAVIGVIQYGGGMVGAALVGVLANQTPVPMGAVMTFGGLGCLALVLWTQRRTR